VTVQEILALLVVAFVVAVAIRRRRSRPRSACGGGPPGSPANRVPLDLRTRPGKGRTI
jgi:hypothetical protein